MKTIGEQLNLFYKKNQKILDSNHLKPGKVIFRPISKHVHAWFEQFKDKNDFDKKSPNVDRDWIKLDGPSTFSQKRRVISFWGILNEDEKDGLTKFSLNEDGRKLVDLYFKKKGFKEKGEKILPDYIQDHYIKIIRKTNFDNINKGTSTVLRSLRMIANEGYFFVSSSSLRVAPDIIKSFCFEYFNHTGISPDLLNWVLGIIEPLNIVKETKIKSKDLLDVSLSDSNKIKVYELTYKGIELMNSLSIISEKFLPFENIGQNFIEPSSEQVSENIFERRNRLISPSSLSPRKLTNNTFDGNLRSSNLSSRGRANPEMTQKLRTQSNMRHQTAYYHAKQFIFQNKNQPFDIHGNVDLYFKNKGVFHVFEIKSWVPSNLHSQFRDGNIKLLEYTFQNKSTHFKKGECCMHLLFHNDPSDYFRPYWIKFMKSLNINLCFMRDKKIVWHKDFKNNDPFLKN
jgi:hypothetical protein